MMIRQMVAGAAIVGTLGMGGLALAGTAGASTGSDGASGGSVTVTHTTTVNRTNVGSGNSFLNGTRLSVANGNRLTLNVSILDGALSNNVFNSGANSFNTTQVKGNGNFNTVTVTKNETNTTTITTNNTASNGSSGHPH